MYGVRGRLEDAGGADAARPIQLERRLRLAEKLPAGIEESDPECVLDARLRQQLRGHDLHVSRLSILFGGRFGGRGGAAAAPAC